MRKIILSILILSFASIVFATQGYKTRYNPFTGKQDYVVDVSSMEVGNLTATGTVTGLVVSATNALQVGSDYITDITGTNLSIVGGKLTASGGGEATTVSDTATIDLTLTGVNITGAVITSKDIVAGVGLSGGEDNVLPGADADTTLTFDATELGDLTFGAGVPATMAWTFSLSGATDPVATWGNNLLTLSNGLTLTTGKNFIIGTTQWNSGDSIDGTKIANADLGEIGVSSGVWSVENATVIGKVLTGYSSGAGTVATTDTILQAFNKLNGNDATNANLTGEVTSVGNAATIADSVAVSSWALTTPTITTSAAWNADPADTGAIRLSNADYIYSEASPAGTDISVIGVDATEIIQIGASGASGVTITPTVTITGDLTVNGDDIQLGATGVKMTDDTDGAITFLGLSAGADEDLRINLDDTANVIVMDSTTAATELDWLGTSGSGALFGLGSAGVLFSDDADGALTITGRGTGADENLIINLDDTANTIDFSSGTAATIAQFTGLSLSTTAAGDSYFNEQVAIGQTSAAYLLDILGADNTTIMRIKNNANQAATTAADIFISFDSTTGVEANIAGTAVAGVIAYNTFLGSHWTKIEGEMPKVGQVLEMTGEVTDKGQGGFAYLAKSRICKTAGSNKIYGVYGGTDKEGHDLVFAVGAGVVLVSGKVKAGDLLEADGKGYARKQWHPFVTSSTLGKATQDYDGKEGIKLIGCVFYSG